MAICNTSSTNNPPTTSCRPLSTMLRSAACSFRDGCEWSFSSDDLTGNAWLKTRQSAQQSGLRTVQSQDDMESALLQVQVHVVQNNISGITCR